jgi:hypothetical protein
MVKHLGHSLILLYSQDGWTPLYAACYKGQEKVVEYLVAAKADLEHADKVGDFGSSRLRACSVCIVYICFVAVVGVVVQYW